MRARRGAAILFLIVAMATAVMLARPMRAQEPAVKRPLFRELPRFDWKNAVLTAADVTFTNLDLHITRTDLRRIPGSGESDPLWRPFIHNRTAYVVGGVENGVAKLLGDWMRRSPHGWMRRLFWAPQVADISFHFAGWRSWKRTEREVAGWRRR